MGSPPRGLPARVDKRRQHQVTGMRARTDRRSLETMDLNAIGSHQTHRGHVTGSSGVESRMKVRVVSALRVLTRLALPGRLSTRMHVYRLISTIKHNS